MNKRCKAFNTANTMNAHKRCLNNAVYGFGYCWHHLKGSRIKDEYGNQKTKEVENNIVKG
jgi:hypothetical protein